MKIKNNILQSQGILSNKVYKYFHDKANAKRKEVNYLLTKHDKYNTLIISKSRYLCVFNVIDGNAYVNHLIGSKCGFLGIKEICLLIKNRFNVEYLVYQREFKKNSKIRKIKIDRFIK
jgi:hypothetical protein